VADQDRQHRLRYIRWLADRLSLRDWTFTVADQPSDPEAHASIHPTYGRRRAVLRLNADWSSYSEASQRHTLVHELIHCHIDLLASPLENQLEELLGTAAYSLLWANFRERVELVTDAIADAVAPLMPLPSELDDATSNSRWWSDTDTPTADLDGPIDDPCGCDRIRVDSSGDAPGPRTGPAAASC
jgi:hypothetical protein